MLAKVLSCALAGISGYIVDIEIDINSGIPSFDIVGLPDTAVKEARERVRSAIKNSGYTYPLGRITINLAPADTKKEGVYFDLAIATALLCASGQVSDTVQNYKKYIFLGELSLDGSVRRLNGIMPIIISALQQGYTRFILPKSNCKEASYIDGIELYGVSTLREAVEFLSGTMPLQAEVHNSFSGTPTKNRYNLDFSEVKGQSMAKRALEIAVAGGHNIIMIGPPGAGKTMLAKCVPTIMPPMSFEEAIEVTKIHSVAGLLDDEEGIVAERPFRSPHHTATMQSLTGGGSNAKPGEISLAHNGVLFLDELPEYQRKVLETLRQPLEDGRITVSRVRQTLEYPAHFMLIASMNPCPCGNAGSKNQCKCTIGEIHKYISRLSGPLLDRIDLQVEVDGISYGDLRSSRIEESSEAIKARVQNAREVQKKRFSNCDIHTNAQMTNAQMKKYCAISADAEKMLEAAFNRLSLSARAGTRILKVARTIADLEGAVSISSSNVAEAIQYRSLDRKYWE